MGYLDKAVVVWDRIEWIFWVALVLDIMIIFMFKMAKDKILFVYMKIYEDTLSGFGGVASGK